MKMSAENTLFSMARITFKATTVRSVERIDNVQIKLVTQQQDMATGYRYTFPYAFLTRSDMSVFQYRKCISVAQKNIKKMDKNSQKKNAAKAQNCVIPGGVLLRATIRHHCTSGLPVP